MIILDVYQRTIETIDISGLDSNGIRQALLKHGITTSTPRPTFIPPEFPQTETCIAWRQTGACDPDGLRETFADEACDRVIELGRSGYCECKNGKKFGFPCTHREFVCEDLCSGRTAVADEEPAPPSPIEEDVPPLHDDF